MEEKITFEFIRKIHQEEQSSSKLAKLPSNFYEAVKEYLNQKKKIEDRKISLEVRNIEKMVRDIFERRERKLLNFALVAARAKILPENLTEEENEFFNKILNLIDERRESILKKIFEKEMNFRIVVFKSDVPEFIGDDMKTYGPFKKGDIAKLPEANVKILLEEGLIEEFEV